MKSNLIVGELGWNINAISKLYYDQLVKIRNTEIQIKDIEELISIIEKKERTYLNLVESNILHNKDNFIRFIINFKGNDFVTGLDLSNNQIDDDIATYLYDALKDNTKLTFLNLSNNKITEKGAKKLSQIFKNTENKIGYLNLEGNILNNVVKKI